PDADGDGIPDACDLCPGDPDPTQPNHDGDLAGDACDLCTAFTERLPLKAVFQLNKLSLPDKETLLLKGSLSVPASTPLDPQTTGVRMLFGESEYYGNPSIILDLTFPPLPYDRATKTGWKANRAATRFQYKNPAGL